MKINIMEEFKKNSLISHIVLNGMSRAVAEQVSVEKKETNDLVEVKMTVNGKEIDIKLFLEHWESQVSNMIKEEAKNIVVEKMSDIDELLHDLNNRLEEEVDKRLEDWERK
ncbi:MAG: hypothetical protein KAS32_30175 [Candidatus Peribacteraceae bacterium]|nr:hypothetical protein [Candidatus Peribacteraceae bacterium]